MNKILIAKQLAKQKVLENNDTKIKPDPGPDIKVNTNITRESGPKLKTCEFTSGPYSFKLLFEGKAYPHSVNLTKLYFTYTNQKAEDGKILYLTTGHSFGESKYLTDENVEIIRTNNISDIFTTSRQNIFYSLDNNFDDFCLINFGSFDLKRENFLKFDNKLYPVKSVAKNMDIKFLENEILLKNGHNTGESYCKAIINFETDKYLTSKNKKLTYYSFKINGKIILISSKFPSGIIVKGIDENISKFDNQIIDRQKRDDILKYYFNGILKEFKNHELLQDIEFDTNINKYWINYKDNNSLTIVTLMGDSGSGFFRLLEDNNLEFIGINIGSCPTLILSEHKYSNYAKKIYWDESIGKLCFGKYIIEEIHRGSQLLPINQIKELINNNLPINIRVKEILAQ